VDDGVDHGVVDDHARTLTARPLLKAGDRFRSTCSVAAVDLGVTHLAWVATDTEASAAFYSKFADLRVVHRRGSHDGAGEILWLADGIHRFALVLLPGSGPIPTLGAANHLGVAVPSREEVDARCARAVAEGWTCMGPTDSGPPVGYWAVIEDPDGHALELSYGQEVGLAALPFSSRSSS